jgi:hypothetical protein
MDNESLIELDNELYDLSNSKYSENLHKEKIWEEVAKQMKQTGKLNRLYLTFLKIE